MQYVNILVASIETLQVSYLYDFQPLPCVQDGNSIAQAVDNAVKSPGTNSNSLCLLLSDAAKYIVAAKSLYFKLFHVTCAAHLLLKYNLTLKVLIR